MRGFHALPSPAPSAPRSGRTGGQCHSLTGTGDNGVGRDTGKPWGAQGSPVLAPGRGAWPRQEAGAPAPAESPRPPRPCGLPGPGAGLQPGPPSGAALVTGGALAAPSRSRRPPTPSASGGKGDRWLAWGVIMSDPLGVPCRTPGSPLLTWRPSWR